MKLFLGLILLATSAFAVSTYQTNANDATQLIGLVPNASIDGTSVTKKGPLDSGTSPVNVTLGTVTVSAVGGSVAKLVPGSGAYQFQINDNSGNVFLGGRTNGSIDMPTSTAAVSVKLCYNAQKVLISCP